MKKVKVYYGSTEVASFYYDTEKERMFFVGDKLVADFSKGDYAFYFCTAVVDIEEMKKAIKEDCTISIWDL